MPKKHSQETRLVTVIAPSDSVHIINRYNYVSRIGFKSQLIKPNRKRRLTFFQSLTKKYQLYKQIQEAESDVFHIHFAIAESSILTFIAGKHPLITTTMGADILYEEQGDPTKLIRKIGKLILKNSDCVTAKTEYNKDVIVELGVEPNKVSVIPWGIDTSVFYAKVPTEIHMPYNHALDNKKIILQPRGLPTVYNNELILDALVELKKIYSHPFVLWLPKAAEQLECADFLNLVNQKGLIDQVFVSGPLEQNEMNEALSKADVLVSVASSDGLPMSILEALAVGTPAIVGNLPHLTKALHDMNIIWTDFEPLALAHKILNCLDKPLNEIEKNQLITSSLNKFGLEKDLSHYKELIDRMSITKVNSNHLARLKVLTLYLGDRVIRRLSKLVGRSNMNFFYVRKF